MVRTIILCGAIILGATLVRAEDQRYALTEFDKIDVSAGVEVDVMVGSDFSVIGEAKRGNIDNLEITVKGDTLKITRDTSAGWTGLSLLGALRPQDQFHVTVALPVLTEVEATSGSDVMIVGPTEALQKIEATSGSTMIVEGATLESIAMQATSGSTLRVSGTCTELKAEASSGASLSADDLMCASADLHASSGASLNAYATDTADAEASSGASLRLTGGADIQNQSVSRGASLSAN